MVLGLLPATFIKPTVGVDSFTFEHRVVLPLSFSDFSTGKNQTADAMEHIVTELALIVIAV